MAMLLVLIGVDKIDEILKRLSDIITMQIEPNSQEEIRTELKFDSGDISSKWLLNHETFSWLVKNSFRAYFM